MYILENSDFEIYTEYLRNKYKDETIKVLGTDMSYSSNSQLVNYHSDKRIGGFYGTNTYCDEVYFNDLWITVRTLKLKQLKKIIYENSKK